MHAKEWEKNKEQTTLLITVQSISENFQVKQAILEHQQEK